ncbi:SRPBCC family protein [Nocardia sp. 2]|uniref:SRPBCC family protein n=1 Tax=Nocardia acididurans TaxID=2802282 RepID=A0ABS1MF33_9NOCA|nr:SRPBCC family protein [Nocardia acididurans]MBL1078874.1 SRPBCC family protein [Nocardia acididurans]
MQANDTARELYAETTIDAPAERVWAILTDTRNLCAVSPELFSMHPLKPGGMRVGQWYLGWNRRKFVIWFTRNVVVEVDSPHRLAWDTKTSGTRWIFELTSEGERTRLVERRPVPEKLTSVGKLFAAVFLGGGAGHADELEQGLVTTLAGIKELAEAR